MANRRMFSKGITSSSRFLMMPVSSRELYFQLGMNADDDGYVEYFGVMRMVGSSEDDLKVLAAKNFVEIFDDLVLVVLDWTENNYLRSDRYTESKHKLVYQRSTKRIPLVNKMDTQVRLGKVRKENTYSPKFDERDKELGDKLLSLVWKNYPFLKKNGSDRTYEAIAKLRRIDGREDPLIEQVISWCQRDSFWRQNIRSGTTLRDKFETLLTRMVEERKKGKL